MRGEPIRYLQLMGTPFERGVRHGREIGNILRAYWDELLRDVRERVDRPIGEEDLRTWIKQRAELAEAAAPELMEEVRGIAEGGNVAEEVAVAVAFGEEVNQLTTTLGYHPGIAREGRCLSVVVPPSRTTTGGYLLAQTWDGPDWTPDPFLFALEDTSGWSAFLADPGWVGGVGINDRGIGTVHTGAIVNEQPEGLPYSFIARRILQSDTADAAARSVPEYPTAAGCHYIVVQGNTALDVEAAGTVFATLDYEDLFSTCAHFNASTTADRQEKPDDRVSRYRTERLRELVDGQGSVTPSDLLRFLTDHRRGPEGATVCRHAKDGRSLGAIVIDVRSLTVWGRAGNPCLRRPVRELRLTVGGPRNRIASDPERP